MSDQKELGEKTLSLLDLNNLVYLPSTETSLSVLRQQQRQYAQKNTYNGETDTIVYEFHGQKFIDFANSELYLELSFAGANQVGFGNGSIINIFREVRVFAPNGKEIARTERHNLLQYHLNRQKLGFWATSSVLASIGDNNLFSPATSYPFTIPLRMVSPFFDNTQLCPPQVFDNLRVEIVLESIALAFRVVDSGTDTLPTSYTISNPSALFDYYSLNDNTMSIISRQSPLVYEYKSYFHTESTLSDAATFIETPFTQPLANALEAIVLIRDTDNFTNIEYDKFMTIAPEDNDRYNFRWGQILYPQQPLIGVQNGYAQLLYVNNKLCKNNFDNFGIAYTDYTTSSVTLGGTYNAYVAQLRRSSVEDKSGLEISNKTNLLFTAEFASAYSRLVDFYVEHVARVVIRNGVIDVKK